MTQTWTVRGALAVDETWTTRRVDGTPAVRRRPLAGVTVEILGFPDERACLTPLGATTTDAAGRFRVRAERPAWPQEIHVRVRFADGLLGIYAADERGAPHPWVTLLATEPVAGPHAILDRVVFGADRPGPLGRLARVAASWHVARTTLHFLRGRADPLPSTPFAVVAPADAAEPDVVLLDVVRWWVRTHDDAVPVGLVTSAVRRALWSRRAWRVADDRAERCTRTDCVGGPVPHTTAECRAMEARWNAGFRRRTG